MVENQFENLKYRFNTHLNYTDIEINQVYVITFCGKLEVQLNIE